MSRGAIDKRVYRVQPQPVEMVVAQPHQRVVAEEAPHLIAAFFFEVDCPTPGRVVILRDVRAKLPSVVSIGAKVVVDHVKQDRKAVRVACIDELLQAVRTSVLLLRSINSNTVIAPSPSAWERIHRHQLNMCDTQLSQIRKPLDNSRESALRSERANMQFIDHRMRKRYGHPLLVAPLKARMVKYA